MFDKLNEFYIKQRFFPNIVSLFINPFYLNRRALLNELKKQAKEVNGDLLDFGCGAKPYQSLFENTTSYIGVDIDNYSHNHINENIDFYYDGKILPFENETFNIVFSSEVLEHVTSLNQSLSEINRVLKGNGQILMSLPFCFPEHEMPFDFRRFTINGVNELLNEFGFEIINGLSFGRYFEVVFQLIIKYIHDLIYTKNKYLNLLLNIIFIFPFTFLGLIISKVLPNNKSLYFGTIILARKKVK